MKLIATLALSALSLGAVLSSVACSNGADEAYKAEPAYSGRKPSLPAVPTIPQIQIKDGDAYTVPGVIHHLRSRVHASEVTGKTIKIVGYIVDINVPRAPACAVHKTGKADPETCKSEVPTFTIAASQDDKTGKQIKVMGWASNFANVFDAIEKYKGKKEPPKELVKDEFFQKDIPFPLPMVGAKVKVEGEYGPNFSGISSGLASDFNNGILTYQKLEYVGEEYKTLPPTELPKPAGKK